jgi:FAD/FMN-containing dehydrogenase
MSKLLNSRRKPGLCTTVVEQLKTVLGDGAYLTAPEDMSPYLTDRRGLFAARTALVARPGSTEQVCEVVKICAETGVGIVPQGGNTGLVGGSVPDDSGAELLLSLSRMNAVREVDRLNSTATVEAGCILADVQRVAEEAGLLFPLSLAAEGSCQIGGNLATNAGGTAVLRYGNARDLVLGLEVVTASGEVWNGLRRLRKDNTGYDLKQLFLGSEGTLGVITAAVVKLFPRPKQVHAAFLALSSVDAATDLLMSCYEAVGEALSTFEYLDHTSVELPLRYVPDTRRPLAKTYDHYVFLEIGSTREDDDLSERLETILEAGYESGEILDATIAQTGAQRDALWRLREAIPEATRTAGAGIKHDVSVPVSRVPEFLQSAGEIVRRLHPDALIVSFGHLGDGNIHYNLTQPDGVSVEDFLAPEAALREAIYELVASLDGSFSAEHGIGRLKRDALERYRAGTEIEMMRALKRALDPDNILNPGRVV